MTTNKPTDERLVKILSETQATINEHNRRQVRGSVEVDARLFEAVLIEAQLYRAGSNDFGGRTGRTDLRLTVLREIGDFFAGFGGLGEPETPEEMQRELTMRVGRILNDHIVNYPRCEVLVETLKECRIARDAAQAELEERRKADNAEPVADVVVWSSPNEERICDIRWRRFDVAPGPLYSAPPAPVVPPAIEPEYEVIKAILPTANPDEYACCIAADMWNACRSAMLQAGNSPVTPDTWIPVSERIPDEIGRYWCYVEEQNSLGKSHFQWNCSWNGERWWVEGGGGTVTHWMPLAEPPRNK